MGTLRTSVAACGFLLLAAGGVATANPGATRVFHPARAFAPAAPHAFRQTRYAATGCTSDYPTPGVFFVGVNGESDIAGGLVSTVVGGSGNEACDQASGILGGDNNIVGNSGYAADSAIGGGEDNSVSNSEAFVGAGFLSSASGAFSFIGAGGRNSAAGDGSFVGAGDSLFVRLTDINVAGNQVAGADAFVGAGDLNSVSGSGSFIGAGGYTYASTNAETAGNQIAGTDSFVGAGDQNTIAANEAFVGSGGFNTIGASASYASILGGNRNTVSGEYASILGGFGNSASGAYAIVAGGDADAAAGVLTFAAGYHADAVHNGSFVWSDYHSGSTVLKDTATGQFVARASGGVYFYSNETATSGVKLGAGSGTWASLSDRNAKADIAPLDGESVLAKVASLPISTWRYKTESGVRHVGPMAQDFYAAFGVGEDDRHITSIDEDGVALAAVKGLGTRNARLASRVAMLEARNAALEKRLDALVAQVADIRRR
jgi:hypothetical protein